MIQNKNNFFIEKFDNNKERNCFYAKIYNNKNAYFFESNADRLLH